MLKLIFAIVRIFFAYAVLSIGCFLMLRIILEYTSFRDDVQFLLYKQDYIGNTVWKAAFYIHVFTAIIALCAGFSQFSSYFMQHHRKLHRFFGRIYVCNILFINVPAGMVLAVYANGLLPGRIAFVVLDCLWFWFTLKAFLCARKRDFVQHKAYMIRSYALTFSAITLRTWKPILSHSFALDPVQLYMMIAWLGFVPNLLVAEWLIRRNKTKF